MVKTQGYAFMNELYTSFSKKEITPDLHSSFVMFMYSLYRKFIYYLLILLTESTKFVSNSLPLPNLE
jgi:hypothetical protein